MSVESQTKPNISAHESIGALVTSPGFKGITPVQELVDIVQLHHMVQHTGVLVVWDRLRYATVHFKKGAIVHAEMEGCRGEEAFRQILSWGNGRFQFYERDILDESITVSTNELILDSLRALDEANLRAEIEDTDVPIHVDLGNASEPNPNALKLPQSGAELSVAMDFHSAHRESVRSSSSPLLTSPVVREAMRVSIERLSRLKGFLGGCVARLDTGAIIESIHTEDLRMGHIARYNAEMLRTRRRGIQALGGVDDLQDLFLTAGEQYKAIRPLRTHNDLFFCVVFDRVSGNVALARMALEEVEMDLSNALPTPASMIPEKSSKQRAIKP